MAMTESLGFRAYLYELLGFEGLELGAWGLGFWGLGLIVYSGDRCSWGGGGWGGVLGAAVLVSDAELKDAFCVLAVEACLKVRWQAKVESAVP